MRRWTRSSAWFAISGSRRHQPGDARPAAIDRLAAALAEWDRQIGDPEKSVARDLPTRSTRARISATRRAGAAYRQPRPAPAMRSGSSMPPSRCSQRRPDVHLLRGAHLRGGREASARRAGRFGSVGPRRGQSGQGVLRAPRLGRHAMSSARETRWRPGLSAASSREPADPRVRPYRAHGRCHRQLSRAPIVGDADCLLRVFARLAAGGYTQAVGRSSAERSGPRRRLASRALRARRPSRSGGPDARSAARVRNRTGRHAFRPQSLYVAIGRLAQVDGDLPAAIAAFQSAVRLNPNDPDLHRELALALAADGRRAEAFTELVAALLIDPGDAAALAAIGQLFIDTGRYTEAAAALRRTLQLAPTRFETHYSLATALTQLGDTNGARCRTRSLRARPATAGRAAAARDQRGGRAGGSERPEPARSPQDCGDETPHRPHRGRNRRRALGRGQPSFRNSSTSPARPARTSTTSTAPAPTSTSSRRWDPAGCSSTTTTTAGSTSSSSTADRSPTRRSRGGRATGCTAIAATARSRTSPRGPGIRAPRLRHGRVRRRLRQRRRSRSLRHQRRPERRSTGTTATARFADVTAAARVGEPRWSASCAFADLDRDGDLDLWVTNYVDADRAPQPVLRRRAAAACASTATRSTTSRCRTRSIATTAAARSPTSARESGIGALRSNGLGVVVADYDDDGWPDVFVANDSLPNFLFHNAGSCASRETALAAGVAVATDGQRARRHGHRRRRLRRRRPARSGRHQPRVRDAHAVSAISASGLFADATTESGIGFPTLPFVGFGVAFLDYDNDAQLDLAIANGHVLDNAPQFRAGRHVRAAQAAVPQHDGTPLHGSRPQRRARASRSSKVGRGLAAGDIDNDGDLDLLVTNNGQTRRSAAQRRRQPRQRADRAAARRRR